MAFAQVAFILGQAFALLILIPRTEQRNLEHWFQIRGAA